MKQVSLLFLLIVWSAQSSAQSALQRSDQLIQRGEYLNAFQVLDKADPGNQNPNITVAKTYLLLDYYSRSIMHQFFGLSNLKEGESLQELRTEEEGVYTMIRFQADSLLKALLAKEPDNFKVHLCLGRYYHEVYLKYGSQAFMPQSILLKNMEIHYRIALNNGMQDAMAAYGIGYAKLVAEDYSAAIPYLQQSTQWDSTYGPAHYNLAFAHLQKQHRKEAISAGKKAYSTYEVLELKADAARMIAVTYLELDKLENALEYYRISDSLQPDNYYTLKTLLDIESKLDTVRFEHTRLRFFELGPENPTIYQDLFSLHLALGWTDELHSFYTERINALSAEDTLARGNLHLYRAILIKQLKPEAEAEWKADLEAALGSFQAIYPPDHQVFTFIESYFKRKK